MKPGDIVPFGWDFSLVALSYVAAVVGSFVALQCARGIPQGNGQVNWAAIAASAVALGGGAIWYMHFIGMLAFLPPRELVVRYDFFITLGSMLAAVVVGATALFIVGRNPQSLANLLIAGVFAGSGVAIMHYIGMGAMRMQAVIEWNGTIVAISVVIAIVAATAALWLTFNTRALWHRIVAALVMGLAVCGMHYTGMYAGTFVCIAEPAATSGPVIGDALFGYYVAAIGAALLTVVNILNTLADREPSLA